MNVILMKHGQTTGDAENRFGGSYNDSLTYKGKLYAQKTGKGFRGKQIDKIFYSPYIRAIQTARIFQNELNLNGYQLERINDLRERNFFGILAGVSEGDAEEYYPEEFKQSANYRQSGILDFENEEIFKNRVKKAFNDIFSKSVESHLSSILIIAHGGVMYQFFRDLYEDIGRMDEENDIPYVEFILDSGKVLKHPGINQDSKRLPVKIDKLKIEKYFEIIKHS